MTKPVRLRLSRAAGFNLQAHSQSINGLECVNVARPSIFGNPFPVNRDHDRAYCVKLFDMLLGGYIALLRSPSIEKQKLSQAAIVGNIRKLTGKNLACWCPLDGGPCHADTLLRIANSEKKLTICDGFACRQTP